MIFPFDPEQEQRFFEQEAGPLFRRLRVSRTSLRRLVGSEPSARKALLEIAKDARSLERSLFWFRKSREASSGLAPVAPWPAVGLRKLACERIRSCRLELEAPSGAGHGRLTIPTDPLLAGLLGSALTLRAASGSSPRWRFEASPGLLFSELTVSGDEDLLDPDPLLRAFHWPGAKGSKDNLDAGVPYLAAVLGLFGGGVELIWAADLWRLEATIPVIE
jgi:hypothetical protein